MYNHNVVKKLTFYSLITLLSFVVSPLAQAHLMVANTGTVNIVDGGAYIVLSITPSVLHGVDDNGDGRMSMLEFNRHRSAISAQVVAKVKLYSSGQEIRLKGVILSPVREHNKSSFMIQQLIIMGRFELPVVSTELLFEVDMFGGKALEKGLKITASNIQSGQKFHFELNETQTKQILFKG